MQEPFALQLHRRYVNGESAEQLALELGIPLDRIQARLRAAALYLELADKRSGSEPVTSQAG